MSGEPVYYLITPAQLYFLIAESASPTAILDLCANGVPPKVHETTGFNDHPIGDRRTFST
jgi:hypothetical protein